MNTPGDDDDDLVDLYSELQEAMAELDAETAQTTTLGPVSARQGAASSPGGSGPGRKAATPGMDVSAGDQVVELHVGRPPRRLRFELSARQAIALARDLLTAALRVRQG